MTGFFFALFVLLHVITAAAWFGLGLRLAAQARKTLNQDHPAAVALSEDVQRSVRLMGIFIVLTFLFGLGAFFIGGGFAAYGPLYHTSLLLIFILILLQYFVIRPTWAKIQKGVAAQEPSGELVGYRKRIAMTVGIGHLIWLVVLVLMFWRNYGTRI